VPNGPTAVDGAAWLADAATPQGVRDHNERLVLSTVRDFGPLASSDVARRTALSAQTASVITRALEAEGLLHRGEPVRGRVGKPSTPLAISPDGAFALGLRVGRRMADLVLINLGGEVLDTRSEEYGYPTPARIMDFLGRAIAPICAGLTPSQSARIVGLGIGSPFELWNWLDLVGAPKEEMLAWKGFSFASALAPITPLPVHVGNDATLACFGELVFGTHSDLANFGYFYIGAFAGGGLVLNRRIVSGPSGNAGAMGPIMVRRPREPANQLLHHASISVLEAMLAEAGQPAAPVRMVDSDWGGIGPVLDAWIDRTAEALATASLSLVAIIDMPAVVIDGRFPEHIRTRIVERTTERLEAADPSGIVIPEVRAGGLGARAGTMGAGYRPIQERYFEV